MGNSALKNPARSQMSKITVAAIVAVAALLGASLAFYSASLKSDPSALGVIHKGHVPTDNIANASVPFSAFIPKHMSNEKMAVFVCISGMQNNPEQFMTAPWQQFAGENRFAIVAPGFVHDADDWEARQSFQFPSVWAGAALESMIAQLAEKFSVDPDRIYLWGFSAGAQFAHRFALYRPNKTVAVAAHAAGMYTFPREYVPTKFRISVGAADTARIRPADLFVTKAREFGINAIFEIEPGQGHTATEKQVTQMKRFLAK